MGSSSASIYPPSTIHFTACWLQVTTPRHVLTRIIAWALLGRIAAYHQRLRLPLAHKIIMRRDPLGDKSCPWPWHLRSCARRRQPVIGRVILLQMDILHRQARIVTDRSDDGSSRFSLRLAMQLPPYSASRLFVYGSTSEESLLDLDATPTESSFELELEPEEAGIRGACSETSGIEIQLH